MHRFTSTLYLFFLSILLVSSANSFADSKMTREEYITKFKDDAVRDMKKTGVPASITLSQACFESQDGNSPLAIEANNHFGIKCANWTGDTYTQDDDQRDECFRKYKDALESYDDHSAFLRTRPRYAALFLLDRTDYAGWAKGLRKAGYATNPQYAERLIKIIEDFKLYELDNGRELPKEMYEPVASSSPEPILKKTIATRILVPSSEVINPFGGHQVFFNNETPYIIASSADTYRGIADEFEMGEWQILKYNEIDKGVPIDDGEKIYLKPKKRSGNRTFYTVKPGQSLHDIAQEQGVKLRLLLKWNNLSENAEVKPGQRVYLQNKKS